MAEGEGQALECGNMRESRAAASRAGAHAAGGSSSAAQVWKRMRGEEGSVRVERGLELSDYLLTVMRSAAE